MLAYTNLHITLMRNLLEPAQKLKELLVNTTRMVGELAKDEDARRDMERLDGFRLVWSLLKHTSVRVQASAARAICPYVESSKVIC